MINYTYVFVRTNMLPIQVAVQAAHASLQFGLEMKENSLLHPHLLLIGVKNDTELWKVAFHLDKLKIDFYPFVEPDMNSSLTALSTEPLRADDKRRSKLKKYKLLPPFIHNK